MFNTKFILCAHFLLSVRLQQTLLHTSIYIFRCVPNFTDAIKMMVPRQCFVGVLYSNTFVTRC